MSIGESGAGYSGGMFRSLRHRNYRLFYMGQSISLIGNWLQWAAMNWLIYELTHSAFWLGAVGFCRISIMFVAPFAGILSDRMDRRSLIVITQILATIQPVILAVLTWTGWINPYWIVVLSVYAGIVAAFDIPIRQAFVVEMIEDKADLGNAIALNSTMVNGARLVGPAIAGLLIKFFGEGWCFFLNALTYLPVIWALLAMEIPPRTAGQTKHVLRELHDGVTYAFGFSPIRSVLLLLCLVSIAGMPFQQFMSAFAQDVLHVGAGVFGLLTSCVAIGAIIGAGYLAARRRSAGLEVVIPAATLVFGIGLVFFSQSRVWWTAMPMLAVAGFGMMVQMAASNTVLQTITDEDKRGRVMSFYAMAFMGTVPLGQLLAGNVASWLGPTTEVSLPRTLLLSGVVCIAGSAVFAGKLGTFRRRVQPIYERMGLVPAGTVAGVGAPPAPAAVSE
jgi:MFS family permease